MFGKRAKPEPAGGGGGETPRQRSRLRAWAKGIGLAALVLVVVAIAVGQWLLQSAREGRLTERLMLLGNRVLTQSSNLRFYARRVHVRGGLFEFEKLQVDAKEGEHWYRVLDADRALFSANLRDLALHRPQVFDIRVFSPVVHVVTADNGHVVIPTFQSRAKAKAGGIQNGFAVTLEDADVRSHARGDSTQWWEHGALVARLHPDAGGYEITLDHANGRCPPLGLVFKSVGGRAWAVADTIRLTALAAQTDAGAAHLSGGLEGRRLHGQFEAEDWPWEFFGDLLEQPALDVPGGVSVRGEVLGSVDHPEFRTLLDGTWRGEPFAGAIDGRVVQDGLAVSRADLSWRRTRFAGRADFARAGRWSISGRVSDLDLSQVVHLFPGAVLPKSDLTGPARISGSQGTLLLSSENLGGSIMDLPLIQVNGSWKIAGRRHTVQGKGGVAGGSVALSGGWDDRQVSISGTASHADLSRLRTWVPALSKMEGEVEEVRWSVTGPAKTPHLGAEGFVNGAKLPPVTAERVHVRYEGTWGKTPAGTAHAEATAIAVGGFHADTAWADVKHTGRQVVIAPLQAEHADTTLHATLALMPGADGWTIRADSLRASLGEIFLEAEGPLELESAHGEWRILRASLRGSPGRMQATGRYRNADDLDLRFEGRELDAQQLAQLAGWAGWGGTLQVDAHLVGDATRRRLELGVAASHLIAPAVRADSASALVLLSESGGALHMEKLHLKLGPSVLDGDGQAELAKGKWPLDPTQWLPSVRRASKWRGQVTLTDFDLANLSTVWPTLEGLAGRATGSLRLGGTPNAPVGDTQGSITGLFYHGHPIDPVSWRARYQEGTVHVEDVRFGQGDSAATIRGTVPLNLAWEKGGVRIPDRPVDLTVVSEHTTLGEAATFLPFVAYADGVMKAHMHVGGTTKALRPTGTLDVEKGRLRFTGREEVYRELTAHLVLDSTLIRIESMRATQGPKSELTASGTIKLGKGIESFNIDAKAVNALALASGEYEARFDGTFHITDGPRLGDSWFPLPSVKGNLDVREGVILYDFADPQNRVYFAGPKQAPAFVYDVDVNVDRRLFWRTPSANVEMKAELNVAQTLDDWRVNGTVESLHGTYSFLATKFQVDTGLLEFDQVEPLNPRIDASAHADIPSASTSERVTIEVTERVQKPEIHMYSSQGFSETEIIGALAFGSFNNRGSKDSGVLAANAGGTYLLRELNRQIPELTPLLGDLELTQQSVSGSNVLVPTVGVKRYLTPELRLGYSQIVGSAPSGATNLQVRDLGAEYRISRIFYLTGEILERRSGGSSSVTTSASQSSLEYNLDIRARHEY